MHGVNVKNALDPSDLRYIKGQASGAEEDRVMMERSRGEVEIFELGSEGMNISRDGGRRQAIELKKFYKGKDRGGGTGRNGRGGVHRKLEK